MPGIAEANPPNARDEERAYCLLWFAAERLLPQFYARNLLGLQVEVDVLETLVTARVGSELPRRLEALGLALPVLPVTRWLLTLFQQDVLRDEAAAAQAMGAFCERRLTPLQLCLSILIAAAPAMMQETDAVGAAEALSGRARGKGVVEEAEALRMPLEAELEAMRDVVRVRLNERLRAMEAQRMAHRQREQIPRELRCLLQPCLQPCVQPCLQAFDRCQAAPTRGTLV